MSFVLDALNKADREREGSKGHENVVETRDLLSSDNNPNAGRTNSKAKYILFLAFIVFLLFVWIYLDRVPDKPVPEESFVLENTEQAVKDSPVVASYPVQIEMEKSPQETLEKPNYNITGHIFLSDDHSANKIFVDEISYRTGSQLPDGYKVISIRQQQLIVEKHGKQYEIAY